eukprot:765702-Hanusia_phi.AAC.3
MLHRSLPSFCLSPPAPPAPPAQVFRPSLTARRNCHGPGVRFAWHPSPVPETGSAGMGGEAPGNMKEDKKGKEEEEEDKSRCSHDFQTYHLLIHSRTTSVIFLSASCVYAISSTGSVHSKLCYEDSHSSSLISFLSGTPAHGQIPLVPNLPGPTPRGPHTEYRAVPLRDVQESDHGHLPDLKLTPPVASCKHDHRQDAGLPLDLDMSRLAAHVDDVAFLHRARRGGRGMHSEGLLSQRVDELRADRLLHALRDWSQGQHHPAAVPHAGSEPGCDRAGDGAGSELLDAWGNAAWPNLAGKRLHLWEEIRIRKAGVRARAEAPCGR